MVLSERNLTDIGATDLEFRTGPFGGKEEQLVPYLREKRSAFESERYRSMVEKEDKGRESFEKTQRARELLRG